MEKANWIAIAYVDRELEEQINKERHKDKKYNRESSWMTEIWEFCTKIYLSTQRYIHCEIVFPSAIPSNESVIAYGVFSNEGVFLKHRTFNNPSYRWIYLQASAEEVGVAKEFCNAHIGKKFDSRGMRWSPVWPTTLDQSRWWCNAFVVSALQSVGILKHYPANALDTDDIVQLLSHHPRVTAGISPRVFSQHIKKGSTLF